MSAHVDALRRLWIAAALCLAGLMATGPSLPAQDVELGAVPAPRPGFTMNKVMFDQAAYGRLEPAMVRARLDRILAVRIASINQAWGLSQEQREKLELAGKGDIKRRFDLIEDRKSIVDRQLDQDTYVKAIQELQMLNRTLNAALFGDGSLFSKALKATLTEEQAARYGDIEREKARLRYRTRVEQFVIGLDSCLGMSTEQRRRLEDLLLEETQPPRKFGPYDLMVVQYQMVRLPEARLKPIFDDVQWRSLSRRVDESRAMERVLREGDYLPDAAVGNKLLLGR